MSQRAKNEPTTLSVDEIKQSLEAAGYPLEIRIFNQLSDADVESIFGHRTRVGSEVEFKEIDIIANRRAYCPKPELQTGGSATIRLFIQAKKLHFAAIVGFLGVRPPVSQLRALRSPSSGLPSGQMGRFSTMNSNLVTEDDGVVAALDPFNEAPYCIQWASCQRSIKNLSEIRTEHNSGVFEDIESLVLACHYSGREFTEYLLAMDRFDDVSPDMQYLIPTLVVDTDLYTYDVKKGELGQVSRLILDVRIDSSVGPLNRLVDVIHVDAVDDLIGRTKTCTNELATRVDMHFMRLLDDIKIEREAFQKQHVRARLSRATA